MPSDLGFWHIVIPKREDIEVRWETTGKASKKKGLWRKLFACLLFPGEINVALQGTHGTYKEVQDQYHSLDLGLFALINEGHVRFIWMVTSRLLEWKAETES